MPNFLNLAIRNVSGFLSRGGPDMSVNRVLGFSNRKGNIDSIFKENLERSFGFEGAWYDRTNSNWIAWRSSLDAILRTSIWILVGRCRDLQRTNGVVQRALNLWKNNVVGPNGIRLRQNLRGPDGKPKKEINDQVNTHWARFCCAENLTPAGDMDMVEFQKHIISTTPIDGTMLVRVFKGPQYPYGVAFKLLELDLLDLTKFKAEEADTFEIKFGIEKNRETGKTLAYWLYLTNPNDLSLGGTFSTGKSFRVPADEIIPVMKKERPMQTIGIPWFVRAMTNLHILHAYTKATLIKAQMSASYFMFITNQIAVQEGDEGVNGDPNGPQMMPVENGISYELKRGQDVKNLAPAQVSSDMETLFKWSLRIIGGDLDLSYHSFAEDTSQGNYASLRMAAMEERAGYIANQVWLSSHPLRPMFRIWLDVQLMTQRYLKIPDAMYDDLLYSAEWIGRRWDWVDPKNEAAAEILLINNALKSRTKYWKERGEETEDQISEMEYEQVMLKDGDIVIQTSSGQQLHFGQTDATAPDAGPDGKVPAKPGKEDDDEGAEGE